MVHLEVLWSFQKRGIQCVGIPGTIDNDIGCSEYTIGFDTAMNTAMEMVDKLRDTAQSHDRCSVVEVMGRNAGWLTGAAALAKGEDCEGPDMLFLPEVTFDLICGLEETFIKLLITFPPDFYFFFFASCILRMDLIIWVRGRLAGQIKLQQPHSQHSMPFSARNASSL